MTRARLAALAAKIGATVVEDGGSWYEIRAEAPHGFVWGGDPIHEMIEATNNGPQAWKIEARKEMAERMKDGVVPCPKVPKCEWCNGYEGEDA